MADDADRAGHLIELRDRAALAVRKRTLLPTGACHYCGEDVAPGSLFCDVACFQDHEHERVTREKQGLA